MAATMWAHTLSEGSPNIEMTGPAIAKIMAAMREVVHVTNMERSNLYGYSRTDPTTGQTSHTPGRLEQAQMGTYDITRLRGDWADTLNSYLESRGALEEQ